MQIRSTFLAGLAILMLGACHNGNKAGLSDRTEWPYGITERVVDDMRIFSLQDTPDEKRQPNKLFYGENNRDSILVDSLSPEGEVASAIRCFLVEKAGKRILFDTGLGRAKGGELLDRMDSIGIKPADIDFIFLTHFHSDHIGGLLQDSLPVFPQAIVYAPRKEADYQMKRNGITRKLQEAYGKRFQLFTPSDPLPLEIIPMEANGHTPGHTVYRAGGILVAGDLMHGVAIQAGHPEICASYDMDKPQSVAARQTFIAYAKAHRLVMLGMHFPRNGLIDYSNQE